MNIGCFSDNWKPSFLPRLIFNWRSFSRRVTVRWWRQWAKIQVLTNQNSRNRWYQIVRGTVWVLRMCDTYRVLKKIDTATFWKRLEVFTNSPVLLSGQPIHENHKIQHLNLIYFLINKFPSFTNFYLFHKGNA